jgi:hypothetical protein
MQVVAAPVKVARAAVAKCRWWLLLTVSLGGRLAALGAAQPEPPNVPAIMGSTV